LPSSSTFFALVGALWRGCCLAFAPLSDIDDLTRLLRETDLAAVAQNLESDARRFARLGIDMREIGQMDRRFLVDDAALLLLPSGAGGA
jgi:hypothetical protein